MLPADLRHRSTRRARERGLSFGELVRESLSVELDRAPVKRGTDPLFADRAVYKGRAPTRLAADHDAYLYGEQE